MFCHIYVWCVFLVSFSATQPFIMEKPLENCIYDISDGTRRSFTSKLWMVENQDVVILYTLCGYVPQNRNCGTYVTACLKYKHNNSIYKIGERFIVDNQNGFSLKNVNGTFCKHLPQEKFKLSIKFQCSDQMKAANLQSLSECEYEIYMLTPNCQPFCTTKIYEEILDIRPLKNNFFIHSEERNFSISLCGANQFCREPDVSSCEILNNSIINPLSKISNEKVVFNKETNEVAFHGSYKDVAKKQGQKIFDLTIKCSWDRSSNIRYKAVPQQGKHYWFEMESIYGCVKLPSECVINDSFLIYNLTNLNSNRGYYKVSNVSNGNMYLNICGALRLEHNTTNLCTDSFSQICEIRKGSYINRGSIFTKFAIEEDIYTEITNIKTTAISGGKCLKDPSKQYNTHISIYCSKTEELPILIKSEDCDIFINWHTTHACPLHNEVSCQYIHEEGHDCLVNFEGHVYDLTPLTLNSSNYEIEDPNNNDIKYLLNVCGPAVHPDVPCMKDSMVLMKNLSQINLKYRYKSLGKMSAIVASNEMVVITALTGAYCEDDGDYSSVINFICSNSTKESTTPRLVNRTKCRFQFEWRTPLVCVEEKPTIVKQVQTREEDKTPLDYVEEKPTIVKKVQTRAEDKNTKQTNDDQICIFRELPNHMSLNFTKMKPNPLTIEHSNKVYTFEICEDNYAECVNKKCQHFPVEKKLMTTNGDTYIEINLPKKCNSKTDFNRLLFKLVCDDIINNEHFKLGRADNCTYSIDLSTSLICFAQVAEVKEDIKKKEYEKYEVVTERLMKKTENCSIINRFTGYKFYVNNLKLHVPILDCSKINFNYEKSLVTLTSSSSTTCSETNGSGTFDYTILLQCSKQELNNTKKTKCAESYIFERPEFCKLLEESTNNSSQTSNIGLITSTIIGGIIILVLCVAICLKKCKKHGSVPRYISYENLADKEL